MDLSKWETYTCTYIYLNEVNRKKNMIELEYSTKNAKFNYKILASLYQSEIQQ